METIMMWHAEAWSRITKKVAKLQLAHTRWISPWTIEIDWILETVDSLLMD